MNIINGPLEKLDKYDWLRLVLRVPFTPEEIRNQTDFDESLLEGRKWKGECLGYQAPGRVELVSETQPMNPKTEKKT